MKKFIAIMLSLLMIFSAASVFSLVVSADDSSGDLDDNVSWKFDMTERKLTISGSGEMPDISDDIVPWSDYNNYIEQVVISSGVTSVPAGAFADLPKLQIVEIPASVTAIDGSAFAACPALEKFIVASGNKNFLANDVNSTNGILYSADKTEIVRFPASCAALTKTETTFTLPETVTKIGDYAFEGCTALTELKISNDGQISSIGDYAFADCTALKSFDCTCQPDLTEIGDYAFSNCTALSDVRLWKTLDASLLGTGIFDGCKTFSNFTFYGTKTEFGNLNLSLPGNTLGSGHFLNTENVIKAYFIKYDPNGGTTGEKWDIIIDGSDTAISDYAPTSTKGTFIGWSKDSDATSADASYASGSAYAASNGSVCLYAVYSTSMVLTYDANGGTGAPQAVTFTKAGTVSVSSVTPTRSGYTFLGWSKSKDATSASYKAGSTISVDSSVTLYAVWESTGPYDITYYNGTTLIATDKAVKTKNVDYTITRTATKEPSARYEFIGWSTTSGGSVVYEAGSTYSGNDNLILYAVFQDNGPYDVYFHYDMNDYSVYSVVSQSSRGAAVSVDISPVDYAGWQFLGWSEDYYADSVDHEQGSSFVPTADVNLYPCVKLINYTDGATLNITSQGVTVDYRNKLNITAEASNVPAGYGIAVYNGRELIAFAAADSSGNAKLDFTTGELTSGISYTVKVAKQGGSAGETFTGSDGRQLAAKITVEVNSNIFLKIIAFFRGLFGSQPTVSI